MPSSCFQFVQLFFCLVVVSQKSSKAEGVGVLVMTPNGTQQVVKEGDNLTLTCTYNDAGNISWTLPDNLTKYPVGYFTFDFTVILQKGSHL